MKTPGVHVTVTTEVGYCPFCQRSRTLRREERQLGGLVRTNVECETCHRTISSTIGPPKPKVEEASVAAEPEPAPTPEPEPKTKPRSAPKAAVKKITPRKTAATRRPRS